VHKTASRWKFDRRRDGRLAALVLFLGVAAGASALHLTPARERLDAMALDAVQRAAHAISPRPAPDQVVIVGIDAETERRFPQPFALWHRPIAAALVALARSNPRVIALDIILPERSFEDLIPGAHAELIRALVEAKHPDRLVAGLRLDRAGRALSIDPLLMATLGPGALGLAYVPVDVDGVARRTRLDGAREAAALPLLTERIAALLGVQLPAGIIDFACGEHFNYLPLHEVVDRAARGDSSLARMLTGKVVLVGHVGADADPVRQPLSLAAWDRETGMPPGVVALAQTIRAALAGRIVPQLHGALLALLVGFAACIVFVGRPRRTWLVALTVTALVPVCVYLAYVGGVFVPPVTVLAALAGGATLRSAWESLEHWRYRLTIEQEFAGYVSQNLFEAILAGEVDPATPRRYPGLGFLFADLRGFTTMSEQLPAEEVLSLLNRYYEAIIPAIHRFDGTIDNFRGDGILAIFGAPRPVPDGGRNAILAARAMFEGLHGLNAQLRREGRPALRMGIGLTAGDAVVGNLGTASRYGYSAVGDAVNVAARLQSQCKPLGMKIIASEALALAHAPELAFQPLGELDLPGHVPVMAYGVPEECDFFTSPASIMHIGVRRSSA
jgi:adenylate cyclase